MSQKHFTHEVFLTHAVTLDLLDYLCPVHKKEVLRVDAFRDLLNKTCQQPTGAMTKEGTPLVVEPGQLVTSVSELSRVWNWHRDKVRDFVDALAERDVLTIDMHKKFMVLSFPDLADRIAAFAADNSKDGNTPSADSEPSPSGEGTVTSPQNRESYDTQNLENAAKGAAPKVADSGIQGAKGRREEAKPSAANRGSYYEPSLFYGEKKPGTHRLPDYAI